MSNEAERMRTRRAKLAELNAAEPLRNSESNRPSLSSRELRALDLHRKMRKRRPPESDAWRTDTWMP